MYIIIPEVYLFLDKAPPHHRSHKVRKYLKEYRDKLKSICLSSSGITTIHGTIRVLEDI